MAKFKVGDLVVIVDNGRFHPTQRHFLGLQTTVLKIASPTLPGEQGYYVDGVDPRIRVAESALRKVPPDEDDRLTRTYDDMHTPCEPEFINDFNDLIKKHEKIPVKVHQK